jgi:type I restriction enzyme S subunit
MSLPVYEEYKDSGVAILDAVPTHWVVSRLKHFGRLKTGITPPSEDLENYSESGWYWVRPDDLDDSGSPVTASKFLTNKGWSYCRSVASESTLVCCIGSIGKLADTNRVTCTNQQITAFEPRNNARYLFYLIYALKPELDLRATGNVLRILNSERLGQVPATMPPADEASQIARFLDHETAKIDSLIREQKRLIELLKEKRQALISHAVTKGLDPNVPMKDSGVEWLGKVPAHWSVLQLGKQIRLQRGVDITKDHQREGLVPVVSSGGISSYHDTAICEGPGVVVGRKGTAGKVHFVDCDYWPHDTTLYVSEFRGNHPRYVFYKLLSMELETYDTGSANPTLNRNVVHPQKVTWPPLVEQCQISDLLDQVSERMNELETQSLSSINLLKERRSALISAAVTGKIDVRNWQPPADESAFDAKIRMAGSESTV